MTALLIKNIIAFLIAAFFTYAGIRSYDSKERGSRFCTVVMFFISVAFLFNIIDLVF